MDVTVGNGRISRLLTVAASVFLAAAVVVAIPSFAKPKFEIVNASSETVSVVATWRNEKIEFLDIPAMSSREFGIDDETGITFEVRYASGTVRESDTIYFTQGTKIIATITDSGVTVARLGRPR